jgi:hypothetical protein
LKAEPLLAMGWAVPAQNGAPRPRRRSFDCGPFFVEEHGRSCHRRGDEIMFWLNGRRERLLLQREFDQLQRKFAVLSGHIIAIQNAVVPLLATLDRDKKEVVLRHLRDFVVSIGQQPEPSLPEDLHELFRDAESAAVQSMITQAEMR